MHENLEVRPKDNPTFLEDRKRISIKGRKHSRSLGIEHSSAMQLMDPGTAVTHTKKVKEVGLNRLLQIHLWVTATLEQETAAAQRLETTSAEEMENCSLTIPSLGTGHSYSRNWVQLQFSWGLLHPRSTRTGC